MSVLIKGDQKEDVANIENDAGAHHHQPDAEYAGKYRHEKPVADVCDKLALAPPGLARIARPEMGEHGKEQSQHDRNREQFHHRVTDEFYEFQGQSGHAASSDQETSWVAARA